jgi:exopolyphosphatase/pppGpp-phosphohydrolase
MQEEFKGFSNDDIDPSSLNGVRGVIEIGPEKISLMVAEVKNGEVTTIHKEHKNFTIDIDLDYNSNVKPAILYRLIEILIEYRDLIFEKHGVIPVIVLGGSSIRMVTNRIEVIWMVEESTGYRIRLLNQEEEEELRKFEGGVSHGSLLKYLY